MEFIGFDNYSVHLLIPQNNESDKTELKKIGDKSQDNNEIIFHNDFRNIRLNKIIDLIE